MKLHPALRWPVLLIMALVMVPAALGHVGTSAVFVQGKAGPYPVYVTVTPPAVIPGQATISLICEGSGIRSVAMQANVLAGDLAHNMPQGMALDAGPAGSHEFHGTAWIMTQGSWQIKLKVQGDAGSGTLAVPLPASPTRLLKMSRPFGAMLIVLGALLIAGLASLVSAAVREAQQEPGVEPSLSERSAGQRAAVIAVAVCGVVLVFWAFLWKQEITRYSGNIYRPLVMTTTVSPDQTLHLELRPPGGMQQLFSVRRMDDLVLDHNHLMHLYVVRWPAMDVVYHLHPDQVAPGAFDLRLPTIPAGNYRLFADIVHADGFPETAVADLSLDVQQGRALAGDDASGVLPALSAASTSAMDRLPDGYSYQLAVTAAGDMAPQSRMFAVKANVPVLLSFTLLDPQGKAPADMANYMGMLGHAAIVKSDGTVFAHIHPEGSVAMAAYMLANKSTAPEMGGMSMDMPAALGNVAAFPFGFPSPGRYRLIVQMKHGATVETGAVDLAVQ